MISYKIYLTNYGICIIPAYALNGPPYWCTVYQLPTTTCPFIYKIYIASCICIVTRISYRNLSLYILRPWYVTAHLQLDACDHFSNHLYIHLGKKRLSTNELFLGVYSKAVALTYIHIIMKYYVPLWHMGAARHT